MYKIEKPLSIQERADFIVEYNHNKGLKIEETDLAMYALEAWELLEGDEVIDNTEAWQAEQELKERERINNLTCTKRVFALMLQEVGVDYITVLKPLIESNPQAQLEWDLCVELQRGNPLLDIMASQLSITSEHLDLIFKYANGELTIEEFKLAIAPKVEPEQPVEEVENESNINT